jgi:hypothetical protein
MQKRDKFGRFKKKSILFKWGKSKRKKTPQIVTVSRALLKKLIRDEVDFQVWGSRKSKPGKYWGGR